MHPVALSFGGFELPTYGLFLLIALLSGLSLVRSEAVRRGYPGSLAVKGAMIVQMCALAGAHTLYWILLPRGAPPANLLTGGAIYYGALAGGATGLVLFVWRQRIALFEALDIAAPAAAFGHGVGRLGCFMAGCCFGAPTDLPWAVTFTDPRSFAPHGVPLHPTQLYEALLEGVLFIVLWRRRLRAHRAGSQALLYAGGYGLGRLTIEFFRGDPGRGMILPGVLSLSQALSGLLLVAAIAYWLLQSRAADGEGRVRLARGREG